ncbi:protein kinase domain-containing protein [Colletotrichum graminicola M1.001]|uniref:Protein kinase domain-containing protein n=1 Tax=Colletotrichum graminicola (strain M1.001 / M2 / FGSC 10212) TaxID=645133 RepID=E3Q3X2_COLGM|nr:protein kinase domain-containing protein [Colletotrichum graminicola M1.001]EFQ25724.1 protein kinase domain-containing protein [Colletotrichum graminicola M1.001]
MGAKPGTLSLYKAISAKYGDDNLQGKRQYVPIDVLKELVTTEGIYREFCRHPKHQAWGKGGSRRRLAERVVGSNARKLFVVLVLLDQCLDTDKLLNSGLTDRDLPLFKDGHGFRSEPDSGKRFSLPPKWSSQTVDQFLESQWRVLAPVFGSSGEHRTFHQRRPMPFQKMEESHKGGSNSVVFHAQIHPAHQRFSMTGSHSHEIVLKEFLPRNKKDFEIERNNLAAIRGLGDNKHITQYLETFSQEGRSYIIFPFAKGGDLENFWDTKKSRPRNRRLALWCLEQMFGLARGLQVLHEFLGDDKNCRHGDLKPGNILHFLTDGGDGTLKIADFGISRIHTETTFQRLGKATTTRSTTPSYEAPEESLRQARSRKYDIWSMGCIFLEFTLWFADSWDAVESFNNARTSKRARQGENKPWARFYKGIGASAKVHPEVFQTLAKLRRLPRSATGTALGDLLDTVERHLLKVDVEARFSSKELSERLEKIVSRAVTDAKYLFGSG